MRLRFATLLLSGSFLLFAAASVQAEALPGKDKKAEADKNGKRKPAPAPKAEAEEGPAVITAKKVTAKEGQAFEATGEAEIHKDDQSIRADHLLYVQPSNEVFADGAVKVQKSDTSVSGPSLKLNMDSQKGEMEQPSFALEDSTMRGDAQKMRFEGKQNFVFESGSYTSCPAGNDDWLLRMSTLDLDRNTQTGTAYNALIEFMGVPFIYTPWMNFPLDDRRRSGLLGPVMGSTSKGGSEITIPLYWNIASNYDATFSPRFIEKRGTLLDTEFRYLGESYNGRILHGELPGDKLTQSDRYSSSLLHNQNFGGGLSGMLNLNDASDNTYFSDLSPVPAIAQQQFLVREGALMYGAGWWNTSIRAQSFQELIPGAIGNYRRLPQVNFGAQRVLGGGSFALNAEYTYFDHPTQVNATRSVLNPSVAYPLVNDPGYFITPKLGAHLSQYNISVNNPSGAESSYQSTVPIFSLDTGMTLEKDYTVLGGDYIQTVEPRLFYVKIPYVDQDTMPKFDTAPAVFSFMQMFTENRFIGNDRVGDADQVTAAMTTRLLDGDTGTEYLRVSVGERFSAIKPQVSGGFPTSTTNQSDVLIGVAGRVSNTLRLDSLEQYNPNEDRTEMFYATLRYKPEAGKVFNLGYRYTYNADPALITKQVDASTQWPLFGRWRMVGEAKYSLLTNLATESLAGFEYYQDCWALRFVVQQFLTITGETSRAFFMQLELNDMIRVGTDPLAALRQSVPGYTVLTERPKPVK